jgi:hypothetical protein
MFGVQSTLSQLKNGIRKYRRLAAIKTHQTRMIPQEAVLYTEYLRKAQAAFQGPPHQPNRSLDGHSQEFLNQGFTAFHSSETQALAESISAKIEAEEKSGHTVWDSNQRYLLGDAYQKFPEIAALFRGATGELLRRIYGAHFKIFYGVIMKSVHTESPSGSQLWHADGGPGTCINLMFCLSEVSRRNGAMEALPWAQSLEIYRNEDSAFEKERRGAEGADTPVLREDYRKTLCDYYQDQIEKNYRGYVQQSEAPPGLILPFRNNVIHRGGYPDAGFTRTVCIFHIYPSEVPTPFEHYRKFGVPKTGPYPKDPAF